MLEAWQHEMWLPRWQRGGWKIARGAGNIETDDTGERTFCTGVTKRRRNSGWRASGQRLSPGAGDLRLSLPERH